MENIRLADREDNNIMSVSDTCRCPFHWLLEDNGANEWRQERFSSDDEDQSPVLGTWKGGWLDGWNGRPGGRMDRLRKVLRDGGQVDGRVGGWDETPRSSFRRTPSKNLVRLEKCCRWHNVPDGENGYYTAAARAIHHDHHDYTINRSGDSFRFSGRPVDCTQTGSRRSAQSSRPRDRPRIVRGTEWF